MKIIDYKLSIIYRHMVTDLLHVYKFKLKEIFSQTIKIKFYNNLQSLRNNYILVSDVRLL